MRALLPLATLLALQSACAPVVQYTDEIVDSRTGRSVLVTVPATIGGFCGFAVGIPAVVIALPATLAVYWVQEPESADPVSTLLFPSFALWRACTLAAMPMDVIDYSLIRAWRAPPTMTAEEQNEIEHQFDLDTLPEYPVTTVRGEAIK